MFQEQTCWLPSLLQQLLSCSELNQVHLAPATREVIARSDRVAQPGDQLRILLACPELNDGQLEPSTALAIARAQQALGIARLV